MLLFNARAGEKQRIGWLGAGLILLVSAVYWPALRFDFVRWDDPVNVTHNPLITEPWSWSLVAKLLNGDTALRFKPLTWLIYRGVHAGFGFNPHAWHALSLGLHLGATLLFWRVLHQLLIRFRPQAGAITLEFAAWIGAAAWAVHPARAEPACWVTATPYALLTICLLGSFWCYCRATWSAEPRLRRRDFVWAWILAVLGYAAYPVGVTYGLWLMAADLWIFRAAPDLQGAWRQIWPWLCRHALFLLPAVASMLVTWSSSSTTPWLYPAPPSLAEVGLLIRLKMGAAMLASVGTHLVWPVGMTPNNPMLTAANLDAPMFLFLATAAVLSVVAATWWRGRRPALAGVVIGCTLLALPVLGLAQRPSWSVADRHVYLPHLVLTGALVIAAIPRVQTPRLRSLLAAAGIALVGILSVLGRRQTMIWRNTDTLFAYIEAQPAFTWNPQQQAYIYLLWGAEAQESGRGELAREKFTLARRTMQTGALTAAQTGALDEAVDRSRQLEDAFGLPPLLRRERARWLLALDRPREAVADALQAKRELPDDPETENLLAQCRGQLNTPAGSGKK
jgi:hypothetical protein